MNSIYWDKTNLHGIIFGNYLSYYKYDTTPSVFLSEKDSYSVYYICVEEFEYPDVNKELPDEIFISCISDSIENTVTDEKEIEKIINGISSNTKLTELISQPDICDYSDIQIIARWNNFPLEYILTD